MIDKLTGVLGTVASVYLLFDFFLWNGGLLNPAILPRMAGVLYRTGFSRLSDRHYSVAREMNYIVLEILKAEGIR